MNLTLPKVYDSYIDDAARDLRMLHASKDDYNRIDYQASELTREQRYEFLKRIRDKIVESLAEHSKICKTPTTCSESLGSERSINAMNRRMLELEPFVQPQSLMSPVDETVLYSTENTAARQVLAMRFLLDYAKIDVTNDKAAERFLHFLTGKSSDNLYKLWRNPYNKDVFANQKEDLRYVRKLFEDLGAPEIVKMLNNEIDSLE